MTYLYLILAVAFFTALLFVWSKRFHSAFTIDESTIIGLTITFSSIVFALLLAFTISGFNDRYYQLKDIIINEVTQLQLIYRLIKNQPGNGAVIAIMKEYVNSVINDEWPALAKGKFSPKTTLLYRKFNNSVIDFVEAQPNNVINASLVDKLSTVEREKRIAAATGSNFLVIIVVITALLTLVGFWLLNTNYPWVQFLVDFGIIAIIFVSFYLLYDLSNPFRPSEISLTPDAYRDLLLELNGG